MSKRPNIVFVLTDDQGYGDLGCTGNPIVQTPNIDAFYEESIHLTNYHVGPTCAPTRASLMTGHYANSTGVWHTIGGRSLLRENEVTLASVLSDHGYKTGIFGKWHLGDMYPYRPHDRGFQKAVVHGGGGISQAPDYWGNDYFDDTYFVNGKPQAFEGYCTDVFFDEALKYIEQHKDEPFFCYIATNAPHSPYNVDKQYSQPYEGLMPEDRARFYGMITNIDENFGLLRQKLREWDLEENTILIFSTDNGTSCGGTFDAADFLIEGYNAGLRGEKNSEYDGGHRVPFFIRWPAGKLTGNRDISQLTANIDFMPTMLDLCGIDAGEEVTFHGKSIKPLLEGTSDWEERILVTDSQRVAYPVKWRKSAVMSERWRLVNGRELYDMKQDREQRNDVHYQYPEVVSELRKAYEAWWEIVSTQYDREVPIVLGEEDVVFTSHDLRNEESDTVWNQRQIRQGSAAYGYYEVEVRKSGRYTISLSRWPFTEEIPITEQIAEDVIFNREAIQEKNWGFYEGSVALPAAQAHLIIQGQKYEANIQDGEVWSEFSVELQEGMDRMEAWFADEHGHAITSAYYVKVQKS